MYKKNKGYVYEKVAENYLSSNGYKIIKENFVCRLGEIDIIASKNGRLHFIEVKGRINTKYGYPREAVTLSKQKKIIGAAKYYFMLSGREDLPCQFDVIEIIADRREINYIENAFQT
ncbi:MULTISPECIES: YraN family protein [unclassified Sedimentibacter]|uniref:YraN family protein n=1 Tax=unclassified Sedimentibacter TaxID=2649220 RepID=UPI0027DF65FE|nr:YraN family protein [Sedimentibacter sp. MB35-C1]WMJ76280.1 YraN family protein [Sedimentibacter sp. MB35-C1]